MHSYVKRESEALFYSHHVPLDSLEPGLAHLPLDREIIADFRGRCCIPSFKAVQTLRANGFQSRRLEEGLAEWKATGGIADTGMHAIADSL